MEVKSKSTVWATGFAMFSMFFGAGNVVFPLLIGESTGNMAPWAIIGLMVSGIGVPFLGLISMTLFNGNYKLFFERIGRAPGFIVAALIMMLIGPFGAMPRLISLSYETLAMGLNTSFSMPAFSILACCVIFFCTFKKNRILDVLGYVLTPFLLLTLAAILLIGLFSSESAPIVDITKFDAFFNGLQTGYATMDLLGAFFFSSVILGCLESGEISHGHTKNFRNVIFMTLKASAIGAFLLATVYLGFCMLASFNAAGLEGISTGGYLAKLSMMFLGSSAGIVAILAVTLACLTTAIALTAVFAEFLQKDVSFGKLSYTQCLIITLSIAFLFSTMSFEGILNFLAPILTVIYPALITLSGLNLAYKLTHFKPVKTPVFVVFLLSLSFYIFT